MALNISGPTVGPNTTTPLNLVPVQYDPATGDFYVQGQEVASNHGLLLDQVVITTTGTYTPNASASSAYVILVGGGCSGVSVTGANEMGCGGPSGAWCAKYITSLSSSYSVTIGAGGVATGSLGAVAGGNSSFGALLTAYGGGSVSLPGYFSGSSFTATLSWGNFALGATTLATGGDFNTAGTTSPGFPWKVGTNAGMTGSGGSTLWGSGGLGLVVANTSPADTAGNNATGYGAGGGGAVGASLGAIGGSGSPGICIIFEYS